VPLGRELGRLGAILVSEGARRNIALFESLRARERLKQAPPLDLETFLSRCRTPRRFHAPNDIA
jgi:hypothetical protein